MLQRNLSLMLLLLCSCLCMAQERVIRVPNRPIRPTQQTPPTTYNQQRPTYVPTYNRHRHRELYLKTFTLGFVQNTLKEKGYSDLKSYLGGCASYGQMVPFGTTLSDCNFGLDIVYFDLNYLHYKMRYHENGQTTDSQWHQAEAGVQMGFAVLLAPSDEFNLKLYARYAPTYSAIYDDNKWHHSLGHYGVAGLSANFGRIGIGGDFRFGRCEYKDHGYTDVFTNVGARLYACFNF